MNDQHAHFFIFNISLIFIYIKKCCTISGHLDFNILNKIRLRKMWNFPEHNLRIVRSVINKLHLLFAKNMRSFLDLSLVNWSNFVSLTDICLAKSHFQYFYTIDLEKCVNPSLIYKHIPLLYVNYYVVDII